MYLYGSIAGANAIGEQAKLDAAKANERSSALERDAAQARERTAQVELQLERERAERLTMQQALGPRAISQASAQILGNRLAGKTLTLQFTMLGDAEAAQYAMQIGYVLEQAGINLQLQRVGMMAPPVYGVVLMGDGEDFKELVECFEDAKIQFTKQKAPYLKMIVGLKPIYQP